MVHRQRSRAILVLGLIAGLLGGAGARAQKVVGRWHTSPRKALAEAKKRRRPLLAVAMDHG